MLHPALCLCAQAGKRQRFNLKLSAEKIGITVAGRAITWATPAAIFHGTPLSATQLDATSPVAGTFVYDPPAGTVFPPGSQTLSATFTPANTTDYTTATATVQLTVNPATPASLTSPAPSSVLTGPAVTFTWSAETGATGYVFRLGTTVGANNLYGSGTITATSATPTNLPTNGETIYAQLSTYYGAIRVYTDYTFTAYTTP